VRGTSLCKAVGELDAANGIDIAEHERKVMEIAAQLLQVGASVVYAELALF